MDGATAAAVVGEAGDPVEPPPGSCADADTGPEPPPRRSRWPAALGGLGVGVVAAVALLTSGVLVRPPSPELSVDRHREFIDAYERSRRGTYVMQSQFRREMRAGGVLESLREVVQRPPDRILRQFGGIDGAIDGHVVVCTTKPDTVYTCSKGSAVVEDYGAGVAREVATLGTYFEEPAPLYRATRAEDGCFQLRQARSYPDPPYGSYARFCFDPATGALIELERHLDLAVETVRASYLSADVSPADFALTEEADFGTHFESAGGVSPGSTAPGDTVPPDIPPLPTVAPPAAPGGTAGTTGTTVAGPDQAPATSVAPAPAPTTTVARRCPGDPVDPAVPCDDGDRILDLLAACESASDPRLAARALWDRRLSVNDPRLAGTACATTYVQELFRHGYRPSAG